MRAPKEAICQATLPVRPWAEPALARLPGLMPVAPGGWLQVDDAYAAQMARRRALVAEKGRAVLRVGPGAAPALAELLERVLAELAGRADFSLGAGTVRCPDGRVVGIDRDAPLATLSELVQEDFCILEKPEGAQEHVMTAALLCFPASWMLAEKFGRPLAAIHAPVAAYSREMARRVQRLFDGVRPERPIWRANCLLYDDPELFQPRRENAPRKPARGEEIWVRVERQTIVKLENTGAAVFSIHTCQVPLSSLSAADQAALRGRDG